MGPTAPPGGADAPLVLLGESKRRLLEALLGGPRGAPELARLLGIDTNAVRKHLDSLGQMGAVQHEFRRMGTGRPKKLYHLGPAGLELFPRRYDVLFSRLLDELLRTGGRAYVGAILARMAREAAEGLPIPADGTPRERLDALAEALDAMGFRCQVETRDGRLCIVNRNCIALRVASLHPGLICRRFHSTLISTALRGARVELRGCIARGDPVCEHLVRPGPDLKDKKVPKVCRLR